jgi:hypothetical protein
MNNIDLIIDALSVAQNSVWSALNEEALARARELKAELTTSFRNPIKVRPAEFAATVSAGVGADFIGTPMIWAEWPTPKPAIVKWSIPVNPNNFGEPLTQPEQSNYSDIVSDGGLDPRNKFDAQPEQEPVAWCSLNGRGEIGYFDGKPMIMVGKVGNDCHTTPLYALEVTK